MKERPPTEAASHNTKSLIPTCALGAVITGSRVGFLPLRHRASFVVTHLRNHARAVHDLHLLRYVGIARAIANALIDPSDIVGGRPGAACDDQAGDKRQSRNSHLIPQY